MASFHGDLLIGGAALRNLDGELRVDQPSAKQSPPHWSGTFSVKSEDRELLEIGRQYLLILDDGRKEKVVLTEIRDGSEQSCDVTFDGMN